MKTATINKSAASSQRPMGLNSAGLSYGVLFVIIELSIQTIAFATRHFNTTKTFPLASPTVVFTIELAKFILCFLLFCGQQRRFRFIPSPIYLVPALFSVVASNAFYYCTNLMPLPTWNIFGQSRAVFSAVAGYVILGRPIRRRQWLATAPLFLAIVVGVFFCPEVEGPKAMTDEKDVKNSPTTQNFVRFILTIFGVACSAFSANGVSFIGKSEHRPITERLIQFYFFCACLSFIWAEFMTGNNMYDVDIKMFFPLDFYLNLLNAIVAIPGGLAVMYIFLTRLGNTAMDKGINPDTVAALTPPAVLVGSSLANSVLFPSQPGYPLGVLTIILLLTFIASYLNSRPPPSPEEQLINSRQDV